MADFTTGNRFNTLLGAAGEHFVMSKILLMNMVACLAPQRAPGVDIVVTDASGNTQCAVQVKSQRLKGSAKPRSWTMGAKSELLVGAKLFYCFVGFLEIDTAPITYVVPSDVVSSYAKGSHLNWLKTPGRQGQDHNDNSMRKFDLCPKGFEFGGKIYSSGWAEEFKENWKLIPDCVNRG